jgi:hypothetical protein
MPKFFFHIRDGQTLIRDEEGAVFQDLETAFSEARESARDLAMQKAKGGEWAVGDAVELTDMHGKVLLAVPLRTFLPDC